MNALLAIRSRRENFLIALLGALAAVALASGCGGAHARDDQDHHDDHDHLEHHVPPHKPPDLAAAIEQIDQRFAALQRRPDQGSAQQWQELLDIVRWLPEIAGDSDLPEAEWNVVNRVSGELTPLVERHCAQAAAAEPLAPAALAASIGKATQQLRKLATPSTTSPEHGHD
jgi:hypothetical protein